MADIGLNVFSHIFDGLKMFFPPISDGLFFSEPVGTYGREYFSISKKSLNMENIFDISKIFTKIGSKEQILYFVLNMMQT